MAKNSGEDVAAWASNANMYAGIQTACTACIEPRGATSSLPVLAILTRLNRAQVCLPKLQFTPPIAA